MRLDRTKFWYQSHLMALTFGPSGFGELSIICASQQRVLWNAQSPWPQPVLEGRFSEAGNAGVGGLLNYGSLRISHCGAPKSTSFGSANNRRSRIRQSDPDIQN